MMITKNRYCYYHFTFVVRVVEPFMPVFGSIAVIVTLPTAWEFASPSLPVEFLTEERVGSDEDHFTSSVIVFLDPLE